MNITVIEPPAFEPVSLTDVYGQLKLDPDGSPLEHPDDAILTGSILTARQFVEAATRRSLVTQTLRLSVSGFPDPATGATLWRNRAAGAIQPPAKIDLIRPPFQRVLSVAYYDGDNVLQTLDEAAYYVTDDVVPELRFTTGFSAPSVYSRPDAVRVTYVAGYAPIGSPPEVRADFITNVPQILCDCILLGVQLLYDDLTPADATAIVNMREAMMQPLRIQLSV